MDDSHDERDQLAWLREALDRAEPAPPDVVPGAGPTRESWLRMNDAVGTWTEVHTPGEVICDADGIPIGMTAGEVNTVYFGGATVTPAQLEAVGLTPDDVPNLNVVDPPKRKDQK